MPKDATRDYYDLVRVLSGVPEVRNFVRIFNNVMDGRRVVFLSRGIVYVVQKTDDLTVARRASYSIVEVPR